MGNLSGLNCKNKICAQILATLYILMEKSDLIGIKYFFVVTDIILREW